MNTTAKLSTTIWTDDRYPAWGLTDEERLKFLIDPANTQEKSWTVTTEWKCAEHQTPDQAKGYYPMHGMATVTYRVGGNTVVVYEKQTQSKEVHALHAKFVALLVEGAIPL